MHEGKTDGPIFAAERARALSPQNTCVSEYRLHYSCAETRSTLSCTHLARLAESFEFRL